MVSRKKERTSINKYSFDHVPSRPAGDVLQDITGWYRSLDALPGGGERSGLEWTHFDEVLDFKGLYQRNGWPDNFDGDAFEIGLARGYAVSSAKDVAEEPLRQVEKLSFCRTATPSCLREPHSRPPSSNKQIYRT